MRELRFQVALFGRSKSQSLGEAASGLGVWGCRISTILEFRDARLSLQTHVGALYIILTHLKRVGSRCLGSYGSRPSEAGRSLQASRLDSLHDARKGAAQAAASSSPWSDSPG